MPDTAPSGSLAARIERLWEQRDSLTPVSADADARAAIEQALDALDGGRVRVAEPGPDGWLVHQWLKKAVLLSFRLQDSAPMPGAGARRCLTRCR